MKIDQLLDGMAERLGGIDRLRLAPTVRVKGTVGMGEMRGDFDAVEDGAGYRGRMDLDMGIFRQTNGFDGRQVWIVDTNGKVRSTVDGERIEEHLVIKKFGGWHYLVDRASYDFSVEEQEDRYLLQVISRNHRDKPFATATFHVDKGTLLIARRELVERGHRQQTELSDYREMGGILMPAMTREVDAAGNETVVTVSSVEVIDHLDESLFDPPAEDVRDYRFPDGGVSAVIPIRIPFDHIFADVEIGGKSYEFVVDTGAGSTVLGADLAAELGLESLGSFNAQGVSGAQEMSLVRVPEMIVGGVALENQQVIAIDFAELNKKLPGMRGLLGMDFINRFVVKLDYVKGEMEVFDREHFLYDGDGERIAIDGDISFTMSFDGHEGKFHIDTGAGGVSIHAPFVKKLSLLPRPEAMPSSSAVSGVGTVELKIYRALSHRLRIGSFELADVPVEFTDIETGAFANEAVIGNVGAVVWRRFITYFDFTGGWMIVEPNTNFSEPFRMGRLGASFKIENGRYIADAITTHSPAMKLGLERGDELLEIDGTRAADLTIDQLHLLFCAPKGTVRHLRLRRAAGGERELDVPLDDFVKHYDA